MFYPELVPDNSTQTVEFAAMDSVKHKRIQIDTDLLKKYEGNYIVDTETVYVIEGRDNSLCMHEASSSRITPLIAVAENKFRDDESTFLVSFIENNENIIERMIFQEASEKSTGEKEKPLTSAQEAGIVGTYYNDELEFTVRIKKTDEGLAVCNLRLGCFPIYSTSDDKFKCGHDFFCYISFYRNLNNDIEGFLVSGFFISNIRFIKQGNY